MEYILTEEQYFKTMDRIFNSLFNPIRYKTIRGYIHIFVGAKLIQKMVYIGNRYGKRTEIMLYSKQGELYIDPKVYNQIIKVVPILEGNKLIIEFFGNWFESKFGVRPKRVYFGSRQIMDSLS
jgi:hypothetical protein